MKCQKCAKLAVVHLTEVVGDEGGGKRAVEIHLCLGHAAEAGLIAPGSDMLPSQMFSAQPKKAEAKGSAGAESPMAIVPAASVGGGGGLTLARSKEGEGLVCPVCGLTWGKFRQTGLMGCAHDYELFEGKLSPLLKRAQEGAAEHVGKVPPGKKTAETERQAALLRLRRELQKAIDVENYEEAAKLRDRLRMLEAN